MAAGVAAAHGDQDVVGAEAAMHEARLGERVRVVAVLRVVFAIAVLAGPMFMKRKKTAKKQNTHA